MKIIELKIKVLAKTYFFKTFEGSGIQLSKTVAAFDSLSSQGVVTEETFRIPITTDVMEAFGNLIDLKEEAKINLNEAIPGGIVIDGLEQFTGTFQIIAIYKDQESKEGQLELIFSGDESGLKSSLENITIQSILSDSSGVPLEIDFTYADLLAFWDDPLTYIAANGISFFLAENGQKWGIDGSLENVNFKYQFPLLYNWRIIELIEDKLGVVLNFNGFDDYINWQGIPLKRYAGLEPIINQNFVSATGSMFRSADAAAVTIPILTGLNPKPVAADYNYKLNFNSLFQKDPSLGPIFNVGSDIFAPPYPGTYQMSLTIDADYLFDTDPPIVTESWVARMNIAMFDTSDLTTIRKYVGSKFLRSFTDAVSNTVTYYFSVDFTAAEVSAAKTFSFYMAMASDQWVSVDFTFKVNSTLTVTQSPQIPTGGSIILASNIDEDLTCWDFVKTLILQGNLVIEANNINEYTLTPWTGFLETQPSPKQFLDDRIIANKETKIAPFSTTGPKTIKMNWALDEDLFNQRFKTLSNETYGYFKNKTNTDFGSEVLEIELPFAATPIAEPIGTNFPMPFFVDDELKPIDIVPRMVFYYFDTGAERLNLTGAGFTVTNLPLTDSFNVDSPTMGHWLYNNSLGEIDETPSATSNISTEFQTNLNFWVNRGYPVFTDLVSLFWERYLVETYSEESRLVNIDLNLYDFELAELTMAKQYVLDNVNYRMIAAKNYSLITENPVSVELAKRTSQTRLTLADFYPYQVVANIVYWKDSQTNATLGVSPGTPSSLAAACKIYGFTYDSTDYNAATPNGQGLNIGIILT